MVSSSNPTHRICGSEEKSDRRERCDEKKREPECNLDIRHHSRFLNSRDLGRNMARVLHHQSKTTRSLPITDVEKSEENAGHQGSAQNSTKGAGKLDCRCGFTQTRGACPALHCDLYDPHDGAH